MTSPFNDNVFPSTYPSSRRPWRNACVRADTEVEPRYPIRRIFVGCCAQTGRQKAENNGASAKLMTVFLIGFLRACALCYLITLSALARTFGGIVRPICLAAFRLMMNSNFFGCSTGKAARRQYGEAIPVIDFTIHAAWFATCGT
jgi:hypothetical protein